MRIRHRVVIWGVNYSDFIFIGTCGGITSYIGDSYCDDNNNNLECNYDGGDCCGPNVNTDYCTECLCLDDVTTLTPTTSSSTPSPTHTITTTLITGNTTAGITLPFQDLLTFVKSFTTP